MAGQGDSSSRGFAPGVAQERQQEGGAALEIARLFHEVYERLAPTFGYETRPETRAFDPKSPNGRLMIAVVGEVLAALPEVEEAERRMWGYLFDNPDTGREHAYDHPIKSGECPDAKNVCAATGPMLLRELQLAWEGWAEGRKDLDWAREDSGKLRSRAEAAERARDEARQLSTDAHAFGHEMKRQRDDALAERDVARKLAGLGCDANNGGAHNLMAQGSYRFCAACGEAIRAPDLRERARLAEADRDRLSAEVERLEQKLLEWASDTSSADKAAADYAALNDAFNENFAKLELAKEGLENCERGLTWALGLIVEFAGLNGFRNLSDEELGRAVISTAERVSEVLGETREALTTIGGGDADTGRAALKEGGEQ